MEAIAQGEVWTGADAKRLGLVDKFGDLQDAVAAAAKMANLAPNYTVTYIERQPSFTDRFLMNSRRELRTQSPHHRDGADVEASLSIHG